jgi:hypothetical protein
MRPECAFGEFVELPGLDISLQLPIPRLGIEPRKPFSQPGELLGGERLDLFLKVLYLSHRRLPVPSLSETGVGCGGVPLDVENVGTRLPVSLDKGTQHSPFGSP